MSEYLATAFWVWMAAQLPLALAFGAILRRSAGRHIPLGGVYGYRPADGFTQAKVMGGFEPDLQKAA